MATNPGSGSIIFKVSIALLAVLLILIIKIPAGIWEKEKSEKIQSQFNMTSIYEAEKFYHRLVNKYTTDKDELISILKQDSSLHQTQQLVNYTQDLKKSINNYLSNDLIKGYLTIDQTLQAIISDLEINERYFKINKDILSSSEELIVKLSIFYSDINYPNYSAFVSYLDSIYQLQRDMTDFTLQTAASKSASDAEKANLFISKIESEKFSEEWSKLSVRLKEFRLSVKEDANISQNTSVSDRLKDFIEKIDNNISKVKVYNNSENINSAKATADYLNSLYQKFLSDFLITSKYGMYRLSLEDSMVLYISDKNFFSPVSNERYLIEIDQDSSDVKVESPVLVQELKKKLTPLANQISQLNFTKQYLEYQDSLAAIYNKGLKIKSAIRRDFNITIKNKEIEATIKKYKNGSEHSAALNLVNFVETVHNSNSYSELKENIEKARNAVGIFKQVYAGNVFDNIDSLTTEIENHLLEFNTLLDEKRKLPKEVQKFDINSFSLNKISDKIKAQGSSANVDNLSTLQSDLEDALLYAAEGKSIRVYGIFKKSIENFGYVYKNSKSWEEEETN